MTRSFFNAHVQGECTHYCQPGIADLWVESLQILMQALNSRRVSLEGSKEGQGKPENKEEEK